MSDELPSPELAVIDPRKLRDYALNHAHETGRHKAAFFAQMGYVADNWRTLENDIRHQHLTRPAQPGQPSPFGQKYTITAPIRGPLGPPRWITTVWLVRPQNEYAELVTIEPASRRRE